MKFDANSIYYKENPLDRARLDLCTLYAINSAMWMRLCTRGETPVANEQLKNELVTFTLFSNHYRNTGTVMYAGSYQGVGASTEAA